MCVSQRRYVCACDRCVCACACGSKVLRLGIEGGGPRNALGHRPEPEVLPLPAETSREARAAPGSIQSLKCCPCQQKRAARLPRESAAPGSIEGGGPETRSGTVQRLQSAAPGSIERGGPETRSGTVQSLKCCPCQQKRAARLQGSKVLRLAASRGGAPKRARAPSKRAAAAKRLKARKCCAWQHRGGGPRNALGHRPEPEVLSRNEPRGSEARKCCAWQHQGGGPRNALGHRPEAPKCCACQQKRPEPEALPLPAETSREARKCCAWQHRGGGPETRSGTVQSLKCCPCQQKRAARLRGSKVLRLAASRRGAPKRARAPSRA